MRRTAFAVATVVALVVLAAGAAIAANAGLLRTDDDQAAGQLTPADPDADGVRTIVVEPAHDPSAGVPGSPVDGRSADDAPGDDDGDRDDRVEPGDDRDDGDRDDRVEPGDDQDDHDDGRDDDD